MDAEILENAKWRTFGPNHTAQPDIFRRPPMRTDDRYIYAWCTRCGGNIRREPGEFMWSHHVAHD